MLYHFNQPGFAKAGYSMNVLPGATDDYNLLMKLSTKPDTIVGKLLKICPSKS